MNANKTEKNKRQSDPLNGERVGGGRWQKQPLNSS